MQHDASAPTAAAILCYAELKSWSYHDNSTDQGLGRSLRERAASDFKECWKEAGLHVMAHSLEGVGILARTVVLSTGGLGPKPWIPRHDSR